jgi:hypothetical protein
MKTITLFFILITLSINQFSAQSYKILVSEDAFVQGGQTADDNLGKTAIKKLMVGNSKANNKYARKTFLKFTLPSNLNSFNSITLNIPIKVFKSDVNPGVKFKLDIFLVKNNNWKEDKITWNNAEEVDSKIGSIEIAQSQNDKNEWHKIELDASLIKELLKVQKGNILTLALLNIDFNKTSAIMPSKEQSKKTASYLIIE